MCNIQHSEFKIQYSIFKIQYSKFNIQHSKFKIRCHYSQLCFTHLKTKFEYWILTPASLSDAKFNILIIILLAWNQVVLDSKSFLAWNHFIWLVRQPWHRYPQFLFHCPKVAMPPILWSNINFQYILLRFLPKKLTLRACHILSPLLDVEGIIQFWPYF